MATETPEVPEGFQSADAPTTDDGDTVEVDRPGVSEALQGEILAKKPNRGPNDNMVVEVKLTDDYQGHQPGDLVHFWATGGIEKMLTDAGDTDPVPRTAEIFLYVIETWETDEGEQRRNYDVTYEG